MPANHFSARYVVALSWFLCASITLVGRSEEPNDTTIPGDASTVDEAQPAKRWYTNLTEAKRAANDSGRPLMIVFR